MILGVDEVGRGAWAGPLVVGAVTLNGETIEGLTDSKMLTKKRREGLYDEIIASNASVGLGWVSAQEIDTIGLSEALKVATRRAVEQILTPYHEIIIDGTINFLAGTTKGKFVTTLKKADLLIPSVSAASIVAKVARDKWMADQDTTYCDYKFSEHVGYGTAAHKQALDTFGVCELHRRSFSPVQKILQEIPESIKTNSSTVRSTKQIGDKAEEVAAEYLRANGHTIIARNWKTRFCEIDIVSQHNGTVYFTEVKHRKDVEHGDGLAAITIKKRRQMEFAAKYFATSHGKLKDASLLLAAASVSGSPPVIQEWLTIE